MSLIPLLYGDPFNYPIPSRLPDQHFGLHVEPEDLLAPMIPREMHVTRCPAGYLRSWRSAATERYSGSTITTDKDKFQANLDVQHFKPEEISVKVSENTISVEGNHDEKGDEHGFISRHFVRRYVVPKWCDMDRIESKLSSDGVLTIAAPRISSEEHKAIPIVQTGQPSKVLEKKLEKNEK